MNKGRVIAIAIVLALSSLLFPSISSKVPCAAGQVVEIKPTQTNYTLIVTMFDWFTETPVSNVSFIMTINETEISGITNSTGAFSYRWVAEKKQSVYMFARRLVLGSNYTAIRICSTMISTSIFSEWTRSLNYVAYYSRNQTFYEDILANLWTSVTENRTIINCQIWIEKGKAVRISNYDPARGKIQLYVNPGLPIPEAEPTDYEDWFFIPIDYPITIMDVPDFTETTRYTPLTTTIGKNTTVINWMHHATNEFYRKIMKPIEQRLIWYDYQGFPLENERRDYLQTLAMFGQASNFIERGNYSLGLDYLNQAQERSKFVVSELDAADNYISMTAVLVTLFSYGFSRLIPTLFIDDEKKRLLVSITLYYILFATFTVTQPHIKVALAMMMRSLTGYTDRSTIQMDSIMTLTAAFVLSTFLFFPMFLLSTLRTFSFTGFIMDVAIRNIKARRNRTLLTIVTVALIVGSSVAFVNITSGRGVVEIDRWSGTSTNCLIVQSIAGYFSRIEQYEISWLKDQSWTRDVSYEEPFSGNIQVGRQIYTTSVIIMKDPIEVATSLSGKTFDPIFYEKYYNISRYVVGSLPSKNQREILVSSSIPNIYVGDVVELRLYMVSSSTQRLDVQERSIGTFIVKGLFDPDAVSRLMRLDGKPLFQDTNKLILAPNGILPSDIAQIREATIVTTNDVDVRRLAREMAFMFSHVVIANANGEASRFQETFTFSVGGGAMQFIPIVIVILLTYNIVSSTVLERKRDISTMAVLGANPTNVTQIFIVEVTILGFVSTLIGFFGSYFLNSLVSIGASLLSLLGIQITGGALTTGRWSLSAVVVALFSGVVVTFIAGLIPVIRVQNISLMARTRRRVIPLEARRVGLLNEYELPLRVPSLDGEMLFNFLKEVFEKRMRDIDAKYDLYQDGTFQVGFSVKGWAMDVAAAAQCTIRVDRRGESLYMILIFPDVLRDSKPFQEFLYKLERNLMSYTTWREARVKIKIVREAVSAPKVRTLEDIINDLKVLQQQIDEIGGKLEKLESMRAKISTTVYTEFENRYKGEMSKLVKRLRPLGMELEPYRENLRKEIRELTTKIEKLSASYTLGEISKEAYSEQVVPLETRLKELRSNSDRIEELFRQLKARVPT
ncbi:MAG: FtsX-like permease family protein [Thermoproteota archaeon]